MKGPVQNTVYAMRMKHGLTQEELASRVRVSRQTIISIEKGNYTPSVHLALELARVFRVPVEKLFILTHAK